MRILDQVRAEWSVFRALMSEHSDVMEPTARLRHQDILRIIAKVFDFTRSLPEFCINDNSAAAGPLGTSVHAQRSCGAGVCLS